MSQNTYNPALDASLQSDIPRHAVGSFGSVAFQVSEETLALVSGVQRQTAVRVGEHQVVGEKPRLEFLSPELDETTFTVFWHRAFGLHPRTEIRKLRELCAAGVVQHLILGGENFGKCLLVNVTEDWGKSGPDGSPLTAKASLTFKEYR